MVDLSWGNLSSGGEGPASSRQELQDTLQSSSKLQKATVTVASEPVCPILLPSLLQLDDNCLSPITPVFTYCASAAVLLRMPSHLHLALLASLLGGASAAGLYTKSSPVIQVDVKNYDSLIAKSNHTSVCKKTHLSSYGAELTNRCRS